MAAFFCLQIVAFAEGDPNIDNGGGGLKDGSSENFWNPGNDGVRVTIVDEIRVNRLHKYKCVRYCSSLRKGK